MLWRTGVEAGIPIKMANIERDTQWSGATLS